MIYPEFLKDKDLIGITAPSSGVGHKLNNYIKSINNLKKYFNIVETKSVRNNNEISNTSQNRGKEFNELLKNKNVKCILNACGGDFCISSLEYIDFDLIKENPKWIEGYSDPTSILFYITTKYDIATIYGNNSTSFDQTVLHKSLLYNINLLKGKILPQHKYDFYEIEKKDDNSYNLTEPVIIKNLNGDVCVEGRIIGGCLDVIDNIIGTKYDYTKEFINRYRKEGIIWFFDIFSLSKETLYNILYKFKYAGYFEYTKCILIGRILFKNGYTNKTYEDVIKDVIPDIKIVYDLDIGHVAPKMTIINGSYVKIVSNKKTTYIETLLK